MNLDAMNLTEPQRRAIECVDGALLLCAGAGSGKTFTLQQRIAYALSPESGPVADGVDEIMAITFTKKAAEEIKSRVRAVLRSEGMAEEALKVDGAWISTIHGMALRILREHALEFGLDPNISQLSDVAAEELRRRAFSDTLETMRDRCDVAALLDEYGVAGLRGLVDGLHAKTSSLPDRMASVEFGPEVTEPLSSLHRELLVALEALSEADLTEKAREKVEAALETAVGAFDHAVDAPGDGHVDIASVRAFVELLGSIKLPNASGAAKDDINAAKDEIDRLKLYAALMAGTGLRRALVEFSAEVEAHYTELKRRADALDMADILLLAYDALSAHPNIAASLRNRFKLVMVDEFQDTNRLQIELIKLLCPDDLHNLCTVGDAQQSIYRFQGADVNVYFGHKEEMIDGVGALSLKLDRNFRSHPDILAFVRKVCGAAGYFSEPFLDLAPGRDEARVEAAGRGYHGEGPRIEVAVTRWKRPSGGNAGLTMASAKRVEAEAVANWFAELRDAGVDPSDMVVLMGTGTHADAYAEALRQQGFSCIMTGGSKFYDRSEVKLVGHMLRSLAAPYDTEALFAVLSSGLIRLSADDLLELSTSFPDEREDGPSVAVRCGLERKLYPDHVSRREGLVGYAARLLNRAWSRVGNARPSDLVWGLLVDSGYLARLESGSAEDMAVAANLEKAVRIIEDIESESGFDIVQAARRYGALMDGNEKMGSLMGDAAGSVRLMTAHSSKGLEFPYVAVVDCYETRGDTGRLATYSAAGRLYASLMPGSDTAPSGLGERFLTAEKQRAHDAYYEAVVRGAVFDPGAYLSGIRYVADYHARVKALGWLEELLERRRLFYVAATRASEAMFIALTVNESSKGVLGWGGVQDDIRAALFAEGDDVTQSGLIEYGGSEPLRYSYIDANAVLAGETDGEHSADACVSDGSDDEGSATLTYPALAEEEVYIQGMPLPRDSAVVSYSSLAREHDTEESDAIASVGFDDILGDGPTEMGAPKPAEDADKATDFGSALHRLAQIDVLKGAQAARDAVAGQATLYGVKDTGRLSGALERWLASDVRAQSQAFPVRRAEFPFAVTLGQRTLQGFIDLLCVDGENALVVDYKTGGLSSETAEELDAKHRLQAQAYAYALLTSGCAEVELVFVRVEQDDPENPGQPQCVRYRFAAQDVPSLSAAIAG